MRSQRLLGAEFECTASKPRPITCHWDAKNLQKYQLADTNLSASTVVVFVGAAMSAFWGYDDKINTMWSEVACCYSAMSHARRYLPIAWVSSYTLIRLVNVSGVTLSASHQSETWDPEAKAEYPRSNKLLIRQALLGPDAKADELNVVQVPIFITYYN